MLRYLFILLFFFIRYSVFSQNFVLNDINYDENSSGIVFDLEITNNSEEIDTLTSVTFYIVPNINTSYYIFNEPIVFNPYEVKNITPEVCLKYEIGTFYTIIEIPFSETPLNSVSFNVTNTNSECDDSNNDGFCDFCNHFDDLPPISDLEIALNVQLLTDRDYLNQKNIQKVEFYNLLGQKIEDFNENGIKIAIIYYNSGYIGKIKVFQ